MGISFLFIFTAGMLAAINPCGIVMLPSYISYLIGGEKVQMSKWSFIIKGLGLGLSMTSGFLTVFIVVGLLISWIGGELARYFPIFSLLIAILLAMLGAGMLFGKYLPVRTLSINVKPGKGSVYFYGIAYAITSLGCTLPVFLLVVSQSMSENNIIGIIGNFFVFSLGMGLVVTVITIVSLISKNFVHKFLQKYIPLVNKLVASIILISGLYFIYYWTFGLGGVLN
ncbi:cytochrome C biosynthesis protein [Filobacillus milosensis]|uniref:Cytochrome C biosynthesis protein n=1 Tax=Filobacillus milosensis TaxID=94137 RepID=A0A4Y8II65_9BACI|nr:cytochrome c biogenesis protein CcdA [Filobacillus milosensis]TFB18521.1 cytochrome C biosynthesis protein [Filobacillus milosensis]